jgi:hypothetical protein
MRLRRTMVGGLIAGILGCSPIESIERLPSFASLENRCIRLRHTLQMIDSGNDGVSDLYLSTATHDDGASAGEIAAGTELKVVRVVFKRGVELARVEVVAEQSGRDRRSISVSRLFNQDWLDHARRIASGRQEELMSRRDVETALDPELSEWSECKGTSVVRSEEWS